VRRDLAGAARALVLPTIALLGIAAFVPGRLALGVRIYALVLGGAVVIVLVLALRRAYPRESELHATTSRSTRVAPPASLGRIELLSALAVASAFDLHYRLVPRLRTVATGLLSSRRRVSLALDPDGARAILGEHAWELVRPDRPPPEDRLAAGITSRELARVVDALEAI
jgi:hypothetical protein